MINRLKHILKLSSHWFESIRIRNKIFLSNFLLISVIFIVILYFSVSWIHDILFEQSRKEMESSVLQIKNNVENQLLRYQEVSKSIFYNQDLLDLLTDKYEGNLDAYDGFIKGKMFLQTLQISDPMIDWISINVFNRTFLADGSYFRHMDESVQQQEWFKRLLHSDFTGAWTKTGKNNKDEYYFSFRRILFEYKYSFKIAGILQIDIPENILYNFIADESAQRSFYIIDGEGYIITASDRSLIEKNIGNEEFVLNSADNDYGQEIIKLENHQEFMIYYTLSNGWKLIVLTPLDILKESTRTINGFIILIYLTATVLLFILTYFMADVLTRRIKMLYKGVWQVQKGDYTHKVNLMGKDEVGQLAVAYNHMTEQLEHMFHEVYISKIRMKELELKALQSQINPHFLNNVMSSIGWLALKKGANEVNQMAKETAKFYRFSLSVNNDIVSLNQELDQVKSYIEIQNIRFPNRIEINFEIEKKLLSYKLRKLTLQPLVENCINHGMDEGNSILSIYIRGFQEGDNTIIEIEDNGVGITPERLKEILTTDSDKDESRTSFGINNVNERIKLHFGKEYGLTLTSELSKGTKARIYLPIDSELE